jgi:hypothetical protein
LVAAPPRYAVFVQLAHSLLQDFLPALQFLSVLRKTFAHEPCAFVQPIVSKWKNAVKTLCVRTSLVDAHLPPGEKEVASITPLYAPSVEESPPSILSMSGLVIVVANILLDNPPV